MPEASLISMTLYTFTQQSEITLQNKSDHSAQTGMLLRVWESPENP